jgi:hypothetical protein
MADTTPYINPEKQVILSVSIYRSDLDHLSQLLLADWWCQEQQRDYTLPLNTAVLSQALLNVIESQVEDMLQSWQAEDWLRGNMGTALQSEIKRLGSFSLDRAA